MTAPSAARTSFLLLPALGVILLLIGAPLGLMAWISLLE